MFNFLRELMLNLLYGEKLEVTAEDAKVWIEVDVAMSCFPRNKLTTTVVTGKDRNVIATNLLPWQRWNDVETTKQGIANIVVPTIVFSFIKNGGTFEDIHTYKTVLQYGMLYGKKRRLVII